MKSLLTRRELNELKQQLFRVRRLSLVANQRGDFRAVARLTCEAAQLNRTIQDAEGLLLEAA